MDAIMIFVLGGPGAGKGTQGAKLAQFYGYCHLSVGDILCQEIENPKSNYGATIRKNMEEGRVGPKEITVELLKSAIDASTEGATKDPKRKIFLIDGFPRKADQAEYFERTISMPALVLLLDCPEEILQERLLARASLASASHRFDAKLDIIRKRLHTFTETAMPVIKQYKKQDRLATIDAAQDPETVIHCIRDALGPLLKTSGAT